MVRDTIPIFTLYDAMYPPMRITCDGTLDQAHLAKRCPLDNGRWTCATCIPGRYSAGRLDQLPAELLVQVLLYTDLPSLTRFRRVNRRAMELVDSIPQYAAIVKHCPDVIRAILSIQADAFSCDRLYRTLSSTRCATCERFGNHLYLIDCRRVCYFCFTTRIEYEPLTIDRASRILARKGAQKKRAAGERQRLRAANLPSVRSLPGQYCAAWALGGGVMVRRRLELFDRRALLPDLAPSRPTVNKTMTEARRYMAIITAPYLFNFGLEAEWGSSCLGCRDERDEQTKHFRTKYTKEALLEHIARYGPIEAVPGECYRFTHGTQV